MSSQDALCLAQQQMVLLLEVAERTGRLVVMPYTVFYRSQHIPAFRFFDLQALQGRIVEPNYPQEWRRRVWMERGTNTTLPPLTPIKISDADLRSSCTANGTSTCPVIDQIVALLSSLPLKDAPYVQLPEELVAREGHLTPEVVQDRWARSTKLCSWMEDCCSWATNVPWCLGFCLPHVEREMPKYLRSELQPSRVGGGERQRVFREFPQCAP